MCLSKAMKHRMGGSVDNNECPVMKTKTLNEDMVIREELVIEDKLPFREVLRRSSSGLIEPTKEDLERFGTKFRTEKKEFTPRHKIDKWYIEILKHSQPAHLIVMITVMWLAWIFFPDQDRKPADPNTFTSVIYAFTFTCHYGSQFWMTFVSGIALFLSVSRHTFGVVQQVLFPLYFLINSMLGVVTLATYVSHLPVGSWDMHTHLQVISLTTCFLVELLCRLYLVPPLLNILRAKIAIEKAAGIGKEIGKPKFGELAKCPYFMNIHKGFRRIHGSIAVANIVAVACNSIHLYYVATQLCVAVST